MTPAASTRHVARGWAPPPLVAAALGCGDSSGRAAAGRCRPRAAPPARSTSPSRAIPDVQPAHGGEDRARPAAVLRHPALGEPDPVVRLLPPAAARVQRRARRRRRARPGTSLLRNSQGLANVAYFSTLTWGNNVLLRARGPDPGPDRSRTIPIELGVLDGIRAEVLARFDADDTYRELFAAAFPGRLAGRHHQQDRLRPGQLLPDAHLGQQPLRSLLPGRPVRADGAADPRPPAVQLRAVRVLPLPQRHQLLDRRTTTRARRRARSRIPFFNNGLYNVGGRRQLSARATRACTS